MFYSQDITTRRFTDVSKSFWNPGSALITWVEPLSSGRKSLSVIIRSTLLVVRSHLHLVCVLGTRTTREQPGANEEGLTQGGVWRRDIPTYLPWLDSWTELHIQFRVACQAFDQGAYLVMGSEDPCFGDIDIYNTHIYMYIYMYTHIYIHDISTW